MLHCKKPNCLQLKWPRVITYWFVYNISEIMLQAGKIFFAAILAIVILKSNCVLLFFSTKNVSQRFDLFI